MFPLTLTPRAIVLLAGLFIAVCALMILGGAAALHWRGADIRTFADADRQTILAASAQCRRHARLLYDPLAGEFSCAYRNPDGDDSHQRH